MAVSRLFHDSFNPAGDAIQLDLVEVLTEASIAALIALKDALAVSRAEAQTLSLPVTTAGDSLRFCDLNQ